ncbi:MAG: flagellar hook-associated protein FlgK, partial [Proteobacteria bacterium]
MADLLSTSISGLLAFQRALDVTSHNISNAHTPGYSRQITELMTRPGQGSNTGWVGNGTYVSTIKRAYDDFLSGQSRSASSAYHQLNTYATQANRINNLLSDTSTGLTASLQSFVNAIQAVADSPTSTPARQTLLSEAQTLVQRLQSYDASLRNLDAQVNAQIESEANTITQLARGIADLNQQIANGYARTGQPPNDLLDQRDRLIDQLATHVNVNVVPQGDHSVNVFIGNGQPLVVGHTSARLVATADPYDPGRKGLSFQTASGSVDVTTSVSGGALGGLLEFRSQMLDPARNALGRIGVALSEAVNAQHGAGMTLTGALGGDFF